MNDKSNMLPEISLADQWKERQLRLWKPTEGLVGKVVEGLDAVRRLYPSDGTYGEVRRESSSPFAVYVRPWCDTKHASIMNQRVAYDCPDCKSTILGAPMMKVVNHEGPMAGREGVDISCSFCFHYLDKITFSLS